MLNKKLLLVFISLTLIISFHNTSKASGTAAGELVYEWMSDSTYRFFFKLYQDCGAGAEPDSVPLCMVNTCTNITTTQFMQKWAATSGGIKVGASCSAIKTTCDSAASSVTGYKEFWYFKVVTLPSQCSQWKMYSFAPGRNGNINNIANPTTSPLYAEVTFNNTISHINSSPYYTVKPVTFTGQNQAYTWNCGAIDPDLDSISTTVIHPLTGSTSCSSSTSNVTYTSSTPAISVPNNPIQTNNLFALNAVTGLTTFTPTTLGKSNYSIKTSEYRNGTLIGSITREVQVQTFPTPPNPIGSVNFGCGISQTPNFNNPIYICSGQALNFCIDVTVNDSTSKLYLSDNGNTVAPSATFTYSNQPSDSVHVTFSWTPATTDTGIHNFAIVVADSTCRIPGIIQYYAIPIPIHVWGQVTTLPDTFICPNGAIQLTTLGGANYNWTILPGGTTGSLSCTNCANPTATPNTTTTYAVESIASNACTNNKDTVTVTVLPTSAITYPSVNISVSPDSNIMAGTQVTFTANTTNCANPTYQWTINGTNVSGGTNSTYTTSALSDGQIVRCKLSCVDSCPSPRDTFSNAIAMHVSSFTKSLTSDADIKLYPNPNNGIFNVEINQLAANHKELQIEVLNTIGQTVYSRSITPANNNIKEQIDLRDMPSGMYLLKVSTDSGTDIVRFIVADE